jgi:hypothetical protein
MIINGRGQLGEAFKHFYIPSDIVLYHTWDISDKSEERQLECFLKFKELVDSTDLKVYFISTKTKNETPYKKYKLKAEDYLKERGNYCVIRPPMLIGKGAFEKMRDGGEAYGIMEIKNIAEVAHEIVNLIESNAEGIHEIQGTEIPAKIVKELILFGCHITPNKTKSQ